MISTTWIKVFNFTIVKDPILFWSLPSSDIHFYNVPYDD